MATKNQNEPIILRVRFMRIIKDAATLVACAKKARGYFLEYRSSYFNNRENHFDHITTATSPLPNLYRMKMKRMSYNYVIDKHMYIKTVFTSTHSLPR